MSKTMMLGAALLLSTAWLHAQNQSPQTGSDQAAPAASANTTVQGCLQGSDGNYMLTDASGATYMVQGSAVMLADYVGHSVEITGPAAGSASGGSNNPSSTATATGGLEQRTVKARQVRMLGACNK